MVNPMAARMPTQSGGVIFLALVTKRVGQTLVIALEGELDLHSVEPFKEAVAEAFAANQDLRHLVIKMNDVTFMDSSGVGAILGRYRDLRERGGQVAVVGMNAPIRKVFDLSGMSRVISVFHTEQEALTKL